jgi:hypothetical protein
MLCALLEREEQGVSPQKIITRIHLLNHIIMKQFYLLFFLLLASMLSISSSTFSQLLISDSSVVVIDFNSFAANGFSPEPDTGQLDSDIWSVRGLSDGDLDFGSTLTTGDFARGLSYGRVSKGGIYAFEVDSANIAIGIQPTSSDWSSGSYILRIQNNSEKEIIRLDVSYSIFIYNDQGRANSFNFLHSYDNETYQAEIELDYISPEAAYEIPVWNEITRSISLKSLTITDSGYYYLKWNGDDVSGSGSRDEFGLDNISIEASFLESTIPDRLIELIYPVGGETLFAGDSLEIIWISNNIDSIYIWCYLPSQDHYDCIGYSCGVDAPTGKYRLLMPSGIHNDSISFIIADARDQGISDTSGWIYLIDTISTYPVLSSRNDIHTFLLSEQTRNAKIDTMNQTVYIEVAAETDLSCLVPVITVSEMATISPASGILQDFSSPVIYTVTAENGISQEWIVNVTVDTTDISEIPDTTNIPDITDTITFIEGPAFYPGIRIYPNPNNGEFNIFVDSRDQKNFDLEILDINGRVVYILKCRSVTGIDEYINLEGYNPGLYFIKIMYGSLIRMEKLIIQ